MPSSLWSSIPRKVVLATPLGMIDSEHEGTTMLSNTGKCLPIYRCENPEDLNLDQYCCHQVSYIKMHICYQQQQKKNKVCPVKKNV